MALREADAHGASPVANHHLAHQSLQLVHVLGLEPVAPNYEVLAELPRRLQLSRLEQGNQVEELFQVVLHRRGRQQQDVLLVQAVDELPSLGVAVA